MKKKECFMGIWLCLLLASCSTSGQADQDLEGRVGQGIQRTNQIEETASDESQPYDTQYGEMSTEEEAAYVKAYTEFLLDENMEPGHDFPIRGYYLLDLNFDKIPELGILHDSGGSMGGYFTFFYFDGKEITAVLNERGEAERISNYTEVLADYEQKKVYLLKEMYLLVGNSNGTYGYVREIKSEDQVPCVYDLINLEVDPEGDLDELAKIYLEKDYFSEEDFLTAPELEDYLITQYYSEKEWIDITPAEYLERKRELIPETNSFVDLRDQAAYYLGGNYDEDGFYTDVRMGEEEINQLFGHFAEALK